MLANRLLMALIVVVGVPAATVAFVWLVEWIVALLPQRARPKLRPWLWVGPALLLLFFYLIYPTINTLYLSLLNGDSSKFVGLQNYGFVFTDGAMLTALKNNAL